MPAATRSDVKVFRCSRCGELIEVPYGAPKPTSCPNCGAPAVFIHRVNPGPGTWGGYAGIGRGMGRGGPGRGGPGRGRGGPR